MVWWHPWPQTLQLHTLLESLPQKDPEVVFWPSAFLEAWGTKANKSHIFKKIVVVWPCRRRRQGQRNHSLLDHVWFFGLGAPGLQQHTWPKNAWGPLWLPFPPSFNFRLLNAASGTTVVDIWGPPGTRLPQNPLERVGAHLFQWVLR
jgi:hypothetical protein